MAKKKEKEEEEGKKIVIKNHNAPCCSTMAIVLFLAVDTVSDVQSIIYILYRYYTYNTPAGKGESRLQSRAMHCGHNTDDRVPSSSPPPLALMFACYYTLFVCVC